MKKVTKSIAAIAVIFGSLVVGGNAALAISLPPIDPVVIPEYDGPGLDLEVVLGSFDISLDPYFDTHCEDDDGEVLLVLDNNLTDAGIISGTRYVAVHVQYGDHDGWYPDGGPLPNFMELKSGQMYMDVFEWVPSGSTELTFTAFVSVNDPASIVEATAIIDEGPFWQKTVSVDCSSDDPVEVTEDTPEEVTEDTPEEIEVDDPIEGSPLFTG